MRFIPLESVDDERVEAYTNLTEIQLRNRLEPSKGLFIAESPKVIDRALAAGREPISLLVEEPWAEGHRPGAGRRQRTDLAAGRGAVDRWHGGDLPLR